MATSYTIYGNDGLGGPIDYSTPIGTTSSLTFSPAALALPSDNSFAVRATDGTHEETNVDARVRIVLDASGNDVTAVPRAVSLLSAIPTAGGSIRVDWVHAPGQGPAPAGYKVWATIGLAVNYAASPNATVGTLGGQARFSATVPGLTASPYAVGVRAYNAAGDDGNTNFVIVTPLATGPTDVDSLAGVATMGDVGVMPT